MNAIGRFKGRAKSGEIRNPKGCPNMNLKNAPKPGAVTLEGKFWQTINKVNAHTKSKIIQQVRNCKNCPMRPIDVNGRQVLRCQSWDENRNSGECIIPMGDFLKQCRILRLAEKQGMKKVAEFVALNTAMYSELAFHKDMIIEGAPGINTLNYQKLAGDQAHNILKLEQGEKININQNVTTFDMTSLIRQAQDEAYDQQGDLIFEGENNGD